MGLDEGLAEVGHFGRYQIRCYILLIGALAFSAYYSMSYVFTAANLDYRCYVAECEAPGGPYFTPWLKKAVPFINNKPDPCQRYPSDDNQTCSAFDTNMTVTCDRFVFDTNHTSILTSFGLYCKDKEWMLTIVGSLNNLGQFAGLPLVGYFSDKFGRKTLLVWCLVLSSIVGTIKSFAPNYYSFVILDTLDAIVGNGIYSGGIIIGVEYSGPAKRVEAVSILSSSYSLGETILGLVAWYVQDWRNVLRLIYLPGLLFITYLWLLPESMRWLATKGRKKEALDIFENIEKTNNTFISSNTKQNLFSEENIVNGNGIKTIERREEEVSAIKEICRSTQMLTRVIICSYVWITHTIVFFGLSLNSVSVAGNRYVNFILVSLAEIPGYVMAAIFMKIGGRRITLATCLAISASSCVLFHFIPSGYRVLGMCIYFMGKCSITASFTILYMFTTEMFPTNLRHSLLGICSMFGRIGSMIAPQAPLMAYFIDPLLVFGTMAYIAGLLVLLFPETANTKLPDNVKEARDIGTTEKPYPVNP